MTKTAFISHPDTLLHVMDGNHPESPARITAIKNAVMASSLKDKLKFYEAPAAEKYQLERVHTSEYVEHIYKIAPKAGLVKLDGDTAMGPMSLSAALHASGAVVFATDLVLEGKVDNAFCCVRPPGHHAGRENSAGFCIFNHVAVGVAHAMSQYNIKRIAIIDFDVHHGDGTEDIFASNPNVMLCSTFQHPFYPYHGAETRSNNMINVPVKAKTSREDFKKAFQTEFSAALDVFKPELIFISAGFDAHLNDPLADLTLIEDDYIWMTEFIKEKAKMYSKNRIVSSLEGGYHLPSLSKSAFAHIDHLVK
jgi:acetoin utilization deacetylase AcuC-like enzyme